MAQLKNDNVRQKLNLAEMMIGKSLPKPPERTSESKQNNVLEIKILILEMLMERKSLTDISFNVLNLKFWNCWCRR